VLLFLVLLLFPSLFEPLLVLLELLGVVDLWGGGDGGEGELKYVERM
jgi:hypothetical protein